MSVVIVGAGHGGVQVAASLREGGYAGSVVLLDAEEDWPYQRPPLSKEFLAVPGDEPQPLRGDGFFATREIDLRLGTSVAAVEPGHGRVRLADGEFLDFEHLVLAVGSSPRRLSLPGVDLDGVLALRSRSDAHRLRAALAVARDVVIVGGGFIGLEVAAAAVGSCAVTVVEPQERVLARAVVPLVSEVVQTAHARAGTRLLLGTGLERLCGHDGRVTTAVLSDGLEVPADLVLIAVGVDANTSLASEAGLVVDNGVVVDPWLRTSAPGVFAIGDCASRPEVGTPVPRRLECVQNAVDQGRFVAKAILGGRSGEPFAKVPWFWTHQPGLRIQTVGSGHPDDQCVMLGEPQELAFSVCRFGRGDGPLVAVESVNRPSDHMAARRILSSARSLSVEQAAAASFSLKEYARAEG